MAPPVLTVDQLTMDFPLRALGLRWRSRKALRAVDGASISVAAGETVALVGESGCGKSTLAKCIIRVHEPTGGTVQFKGVDVLAADRQTLRGIRREVQLVSQDPHSSMNPRMRVRDIIAEPLVAHRVGRGRDDRYRRVEALLDSVGLDADDAARMPHEFSGGQRQRIAIARALALDPALVICDESVSALDVSVQAQILNLLRDLQEDIGVSYLFISHDMSVVHHIADHVAVMYLGRIVESGPTEGLFQAPRHPYTQQLLAAVPTADPTIERAQRGRSFAFGEIPSPTNRPSGCVFRTRCPIAVDECAQILPDMVHVGDRHDAACIRTDVTAQQVGQKIETSIDDGSS